ncbi:hypothetical protein [Rhizobium sp. SSA_523]|uniref:hypothetical protein n=1 Tax=Rhizobium sp. SSA_523 TaxID=2952477 RepID=UPI002091B7DC|nr:hypothetical protein [Rhizobium sp. SSA_523]MCO5730614.1 hypothetical protein [Rhizobium sp. SSA_523]WKC24555.1 hypothetical protein QTJ18_10920 [Rhizobium sp. SSA_523]
MVRNNYDPGTEEMSTANIAYVRQMLGQLRQVAAREQAHLLCYLIEMAYVEAGDLLTRQAGRSVGHQN